MKSRAAITEGGFRGRLGSTGVRGSSSEGKREVKKRRAGQRSARGHLGGGGQFWAQTKQESAAGTKSNQEKYPGGTLS